MKEKKKIGRREFLKVAGTGAAVTTAALYGCKPRSAGSASEADGAQPGQMTYRTNPKTGDRVSLLGYGCMRWPTVSGSDDIDQETVNALVDHAIAHGVNYFDTSPAYCRGHSEHATGVALSRHPRDKYFIATKLSNFAPSTWSREASMAMYRNSFRELQVDYIDYLLLHGVGMGSGMEEFEARYIDNGMLDFLLAEREAGRIRNLGFSYHGDIAVFDHLLAQHDRYKWDFVQIRSTTWTGNTPRRSTRAIPMPSTCTANWRSAVSRPSSWSRCWAGAFRMSTTTSPPISNSGARRRASLRGRSVSRGRSPGC